MGTGKRPATSQVFLSEGAYQGLIEHARNAGYIRGAERAKGLGLWMHDVIQENPLPEQWQDRRPQDLQDMTIDELEAGVYATWDDGEPRRLRQMVIPPAEVTTVVGFLEGKKSVMVHAAYLAKQLGTIKQGQRVGPGRGLSPSTLASQFWEAVGLSWLRAQIVPKPQYKSDHRKPKTELEF